MTNPSHFWGIDPGTVNFAACRADGQASVALARQGKGAKREPLHDFISRVVQALSEAISHPCSLVAIEQQFDRSAGKPLERLVHVLQWELANQGHMVLMINPVHLKQWVCNHGRPDEADFWMAVQQKIAAGVFPALSAMDDQHVREACLMAIMGADWAAVQRGEPRRLHGYVEPVRKLKGAW